MAVITKIPASTDVTVCSWHPHIETGLRCNKCGQPICVKCAKLTAVGYKCPDCVRAIKDKFFNGTIWDYLIAGVITLPLSLVAGSLFAFLGSGLVFSWVISILAAPTVASFIAEVVRRGVRRRRSRYLAQVVVACFCGGIVLVLLFLGLMWAFLTGFNPVSLSVYPLIGPGLLLVIGTGTILARLR